jgi:hypothetical protein
MTLPSHSTRLFLPRTGWLALGVLLLVAALLLSRTGAQSNALLLSGTGAQSNDDTPRITLDSSRVYQTMTGWEAVAQAGQEDSQAWPAYRDQLLDLAVDDLGIDRLRVHVRSGIEHTRDTWSEMRAGQHNAAAWRAIRFSTVNDNNDPFRIDDRGFHWASLDYTIEQVFLPMQERLERRGRRLFLNVNYHAFTGQIGAGLEYHHGDAEEYAEIVQATYLHLQHKYGLRPDAWEIQLEPDNSRQWNAGFMRQAMIAAGNRLSGMGITPKFIAPSTTNMGNAVSYADTIARGGRPRFWTELSYHRYSGVSEANLRTIANRAAQWGMTTAMLEKIGAGYDTLHEDLKVGQNSSWEQFALAYPVQNDDGAQYYVIDQRDPNAPRIRLGSRTAFLRQYFRYIRAGARRVEAATTANTADPVAFINPDGTYVVVVKASSGTDFSIANLPAGTYEATYTTGRDIDRRVGLFTTDGQRPIDLRIPDRGVLTLFGVL